MLHHFATQYLSLKSTRLMVQGSGGSTLSAVNTANHSTASQLESRRYITEEPVFLVPPQENGALPRKTASRAAATIFLKKWAESIQKNPSPRGSQHRPV